MASSNSEDCPIQSSSVLGSCPGKLRPGLARARPIFCTSLRHSDWVSTTFTALTNTNENSRRRFVLKLTEILLLFRHFATSVLA